MNPRIVLLVVVLISAVSEANKDVDNWNCPCHLCTRILKFAITILPSCPEPKVLDRVFETDSLCHESSLGDVSQDCVRFLKKFYQDSGNLRQQLMKLQCFSGTEKEVETLCGHHYLACCDLINDS